MWTLERINQLRRDKIEESLTLDYKRAAALDRNQPKCSDELSKDVSAIANSAGGILIYGLAELPENRHLPGELDPIKRRQVSKEWLESIILNIQPRISGVLIHPVSVSDEECLYVIEIPQSDTAHQATDRRYYKRHNFSSIPMEDYEIRDVMNRVKYPIIEPNFEIELYIPQNPLGIPNFGKQKIDCAASLEVFATNNGMAIAHYVVAKIEVPMQLVDPYELVQQDLLGQPEGLPATVTFTRSNQKQDRNQMGAPLSDKRYEPILPELSLYLGCCNLNFDAMQQVDPKQEISWKIHVDNAPSHQGTIAFDEISVYDKRK